MIPITPFSVKFPPEMKQRIKAAAGEVGYSENKFIVEAVGEVLDMIGKPNQESLPKVVVLIRAARAHRESPRPLLAARNSAVEQTGKRPAKGAVSCKSKDGSK
jgi:hypothetical protein